MKTAVLNLDVTPVFQDNWNAITKACETCSGSGLVNEKSCTWCGDGISSTKGSGKHYRYIINTGSSRSSKTFSLIDVLDIYCRSKYNKRCTVWRDTKADTKKTVLNDTIKHFKSSNRYYENSFNKTESIFNYGTGSTFEIHGTDDINTVHGLNQSIAWLNEPYKISRDVGDQIDQRTEDFFIIDWNPIKAHWVEDLSKDKRAIVIHSTFLKNKFCPPEQRKKILSYQPVCMSEVVKNKLLTEQQANLYDFSDNKLKLTAEQIEELSRCIENERKRSASEYNWSVYGLGLKAERPNRIFHFDEISLQEYLSLDATEYFYSDWGAVDPWAVGSVKYCDGALYVRERNYRSENLIRADLEPVELQQISQEDEGLVSWTFSRLGIPLDRYIICDPNRLTKIRALREVGYDYAIAAPKPAGSIIDGIDLLNNLRVYYTSDSVNVRYEQENYSRKIDRYGVVLEEPEDLDNHHMDGIRYVGLFLQGEGIIKKI